MLSLNTCSALLSYRHARNGEIEGGVKEPQIWLVMGPHPKARCKLKVRCFHIILALTIFAFLYKAVRMPPPNKLRLVHSLSYTDMEEIVWERLM